MLLVARHPNFLGIVRHLGVQCGITLNIVIHDCLIVQTAHVCCFRSHVLLVGRYCLNACKNELEYYIKYMYTLLQELACNIVSYCTSGCGIFTSRRWVKMQPTSEIIAICMLTSVIKCLLSIPEQCLVSSNTKYQVTRRSNVSILIKAHRGC